MGPNQMSTSHLNLSGPNQLSTLTWARFGHDSRSRIVCRKPRYRLTRGFLVLGQAYRSQHTDACTHDSRKWPFIRSFVGLDGIEPSASALSVLTRRLVRQLVCSATSRFVPGRATARHFVPLRLGTLWARPEADSGRSSTVALIHLPQPSEERSACVPLGQGPINVEADAAQLGRLHLVFDPRRLN